MISKGVPQGSVLGPMLFLLYINDLGLILQDRSYIYADDTTMIARSRHLSEVISKAGDNVESLKQWVVRNQLVLNERKTKDMVFSLTEKIKEEKTLFLGLIIDNKLTWRDHIEHLSNQLSRIVYLLRRLRDEVSLEVLRTAYFGLFHSRMGYGIELWGATSDAQIIFKLQKKAIKIMMRTSFRESGRALFQELKVMTLTSLFIYRHALHLKENDNSIITRGDIHNYNTRNKHNIDLPFKRLMKSQRVPGIISKKIFNSMPEKVKLLDKRKFKRVINVFLIKNSFYSLSEFLDTNWRVEDFLPTE